MFSTPINTNTQREYKLDECKNIKLIRNNSRIQVEDDFLIFKIEDLDGKETVNEKEEKNFDEYLENIIFPRKLYFE